MKKVNLSKMQKESKERYVGDIEPMQNNPDLHSPQTKRIIRRPYFKEAYTQEDPPRKWKRPKGVYTNIESPFGLASEMLRQQLADERMD